MDIPEEKRLQDARIRRERLLGRYISDDDIELTDYEFLQVIIDRIHDDVIAISS